MVAPMAAKRWKLGRLLAGVTRRNLHAEVDSGSRMGREAW